MERTFVLIKPDAVERKIVGQIINELEENSGTQINNLKINIK